MHYTIETNPACGLWHRNVVAGKDASLNVGYEGEQRRSKLAYEIGIAGWIDVVLASNISTQIPLHKLRTTNPHSTIRTAANAKLINSHVYKL